MKKLVQLFSKEECPGALLRRTSKGVQKSPNNIPLQRYKQAVDWITGNRCTFHNNALCSLIQEGNEESGEQSPISNRRNEESIDLTP